MHVGISKAFASHGRFRVTLSSTLEQSVQFVLSQPFPPKPPELVVVIPAYNELDRIGDTLDSYTFFLNNSDDWKATSRILVVDDGSDDGTDDFVRRYCRDDDTVEIDCISLAQNSGKGAAVSFGIRHLQRMNKADEPCLVLVADADGSGDISCLPNITSTLGTLIASSQQSQDESSFWNTPSLVNGYRGYRGSSLSRSILRWGFRTAVRLVCGDLRVRDSQCGFKLLTLAAAKQLYCNLHLKKWSHDVEVLYRAREWNMSIAEQTVPWQDKEGSKLVNSKLGTIQASAVMFGDMLRMRLEYASGRWKVPWQDKFD